MENNEKKDKIEISAHKTWERVEFKSVHTVQGVKIFNVELVLEYNQKGKFKIHEPNVEIITFEGDTIERAEIKAMAITAAIEYLKNKEIENLKDGEV